MSASVHDFVVVANRLPVDITIDESGSISWTRSPGGLVTALEPVMQRADGAWVGWSGGYDQELEPFESDDMTLVPVPLSEEEVGEYYEGFSNGTLWPLYHDVIAQPEFHREWWDAYVLINQRFADRTAQVAARGATVWVQDYQLQLVPRMLRTQRPDLRIGFFDHIPFPALEIFSQLPWRRQVLEGLLGADVVGFQRASDASNFRRATRQLLGVSSRGRLISLESMPGNEGRFVNASAFPISIDAYKLNELAHTDAVMERAQEIRSELGDPTVLLLGVDRLDYTKGIRHRLKAYGELLRDGMIRSGDVTMVQVASPSRERVASYQLLRDEVEGTVGRINGEFGELGHPPLHYMHHSYPREEMAALYLASDVMLVTSLRDGMNLVAKEYVAARHDTQGALVLSEFTGAADEMKQAILVNPHDIDGLKAAIMRAITMTPREQTRRMRSLRRRVFDNDVNVWAKSFLATLGAMPIHTSSRAATVAPDGVSPELADASRRWVAEGEKLLVSLDFDGTLAPLVDDPARSRPNLAARAAIDRLAAHSDVHLAIISGRAASTIAEMGVWPDSMSIIGSHGGEFGHMSNGHVIFDENPLMEGSAEDLLAEVTAAAEEVVAQHEGTWLELKPFAAVVHTRRAADDVARKATRATLAGPAKIPGVHVMEGKAVIELAVTDVTKGAALAMLGEELEIDHACFVGDDRTDETAFAALPTPPLGIAIKVGAGETVAPHRLDDIPAVGRWLTFLADLKDASRR